MTKCSESSPNNELIRHRRIFSVLPVRNQWWTQMKVTEQQRYRHKTTEKNKIWSHIQPCVIVGPTASPGCAYGPTIHSHVATWAPPPHGPTEQNQWALQCRFFSSSTATRNSTRAGAPFSSCLLAHLCHQYFNMDSTNKSNWFTQKSNSNWNMNTNNTLERFMSHKQHAWSQMFQSTPTQIKVHYNRGLTHKSTTTGLIQFLDSPAVRKLPSTTPIIKTTIVRMVPCMHKP
jgi:hypothetical protein